MSFEPDPPRPFATGSVNDLARALRRGMESDGNYYSLVYSPTDKRLKFRERYLNGILSFAGVGVKLRHASA